MGKIERKKSRGRHASPRQPPIIIDKDALSLASFSGSEAENVAHLPCPEDYEDASFGDSIVGDNHSAPSSFENLDDCPDGDSILNKKPAAVDINVATCKLTAART
jgi:hypothetical protein